MKKASAFCLLLAWLMPLGSAQNLASFLQNDRLKTLILPDRPIFGNLRSRTVDGFWESEVKDRALAFPQQVKIDCHNYGPENRECVETSVSIAPTKGLVSIQEIDTTEYEVDSWDGTGLVASYGGDAGSRCQRHVLTMTFSSGAVSVSDVPTREKGCEAFTMTNSYRLIRGNYYVDTSPGNDMDKPYKSAR